MISTRASSPVSTNGTKMTKSSRRATPSPPKAISRIATVSWLPAARGRAVFIGSVMVPGRLFGVRHLIVMLAEQVLAEIVLQVPPGRVDVVCVVLGVVVFHQEGRALHAIVMAFAGLEAARPGEIKILRPGFFNFLQVLVRDLRAIAVNILLDELPE